MMLDDCLDVDSDGSSISDWKVRKVKLTFLAMVFALVAAQDSVPVPISAYALAANPQSSYASDPVSYTHLDVYKRQPFATSRIPRDRPTPSRDRGRLRRSEP